MTAIMHTISSRPVQPEDEALLISLYGSTRERELATVPWDAAQREIFIRFQCAAQLQHYQAEYPEAIHQIIVCNGQPVGRIYVDRRETEIRILDITLLPTERGKRIGTPLIRELMDEASKVGKAVSIFVENDSPSMRLFERLDFNVVENTGYQSLMVWKTSS